MRKWRSSAAYQIAFANFGAFALGLAILGCVVFGVMHFAFLHQLDSMVTNEAQTLVDEYHLGGRRELMEAIAERQASSSSTRMIYGLYAQDGRKLYGTLNAPRPGLGLQQINFVDPDEGIDWARATAVDLTSNERLVVGVDSDWLERIDRTVISVFAIAFLGACFLGFGGAIILGGYLKRRLRSISRSAEAIIGGDIRKRMPVSPRRDEFDQLASTLNRMLDRIEGLLENLRQVSSDIAHDLRTPLSQLRTRLEQGTLNKGTADAEVVEDAIRRVDEVLSLFAAILRIAEVEGGETRRFFTSVDLSALVGELAESFAPSFEDEGRSLFWSVESGIQLEGDRELLAQAFINLLENARRHTQFGSVSRMTLASAGQLACVQVVDNGPGVPKADLGRITKRFARLESARNTEGFGLGLSLVCAVAKLHGGRLALRNVEPGLSATIELPRAFATTPRNSSHNAGKDTE